MKKLYFGLSLLFAIAILFSSCATIMSKQSLKVPVSSNPVGANVTVLNKRGKVIFESITPTTVKLRKGGGYLSRPEYAIHISAPGFEKHTKSIYYQLNGWYYGNLLLGGVLGMLIIDPITGAMWKTNNDSPINVTLRQSSTTGVQEPTLNIVDIKDISEMDKKYLVRIN